MAKFRLETASFGGVYHCFSLGTSGCTSSKSFICVICLSMTRTAISSRGTILTKQKTWSCIKVHHSDKFRYKELRELSFVQPLSTRLGEWGGEENGGCEYKEAVWGVILCDWTILYLDCGGGYMNLHKHTHTHRWRIKMVRTGRLGGSVG